MPHPNQYDPSRIPAELVRPLVAQYLKENGQDEWRSVESLSHVKRPSPRETLAKEAGIPPDTLYAFMVGRSKTILFDMVDKLFVAMGCTHLWYGEGLREYYLSVPLNRQTTATYCSKGHEKTPENVYISAGFARCRICSREVNARYKARRKAAA